MSARPPSRSGLAPSSRRVADASANGAMSWAKSLWNRSGNQPVEPDDATRLLTEMRDELRVRLLVHDKAALVARNLFIVHKAMGKAGWESVAQLPAHVIAGAVADAEGLQRQEPTPLMEMFLDRLGALRATVEQAAAVQEAQVEAEAEAQEWALTDFANVPEVSEASHEDYEQMERSWIGTVPSGLIAERERKHVMPYSGIPIERVSVAGGGADVDLATDEPSSAAELAAAGSPRDDDEAAQPLPLGTFRLRDEVFAAEPAVIAPVVATPVAAAVVPVVVSVAASASPPPPSPPARADADAGVDIFVAIEKLAALHAKGILTEAEFATKKSELLSRV